MKTCKICGCEIKDDDFVLDGAAVINEGMENEYAMCHSCLVDAENNGAVIGCESCGRKFSSDVLHDEDIEGHTFTACPACGKDVVEAMERTEFEDQYFCTKYSVVVCYTNGSSRGYTVSARNSYEALKRMLEKMDASCDVACIADIHIGEILLKEDEF
jgi:DNA-directed RNA polymerase subunit RPC12/RpoP